LTGKHAFRKAISSLSIVSVPFLSGFYSGRRERCFSERFIFHSQICEGGLDLARAAILGVPPRRSQAQHLRTRALPADAKARRR
jgi:hypothetical protein